VGNDTTAFLPGFARVGNFTLADSADEAASYAVRTEDSVAYQNADAISPLERLTLFTQGEYQLSDNTTFYGSFLYSNRQSNFNSWMFLFQNMSGDNPNNTVAQGLRDAATAAGGSSTGGIQFQVVRPINQSQEIDYFQTVAGLKGDFEGGFLDGWSWDTFISYGKSDGEYEQDFLYEDRLNAISLGTVACDASRLISDVSPAGTCDGINIDVLSTRFLVDQDWTAQETAFLEGRERGTTTYEQMVAEGTLSGSLFALPAGTVDAVFGVSYRREEIDDNPGPNAVRNNFHLFSSSGRTAGSETVREVFAEVGIPLLANQSFAESVSMVASARYTDYTISGSEETYKLGLNWTFDENIALRASYGTSFRGPNLFELFLANQESFNFLSDPCREYANSSNAQFASNCASLGIPDDFIPNVQDTLVTSGGAILPDGTTTIRPETSESWSTGLILTPGDSGISLAIEYFEIDVIDQIDVLGAQQIVNQCYGDVNFPNSSFCQLLTRNSGNVANPFILTGVNDRFLNIDLQRNRGIDYQLNYAGEIGGFEVSAGAQYTYQLEDQVTRVIDGVVDVEQLLGDPNEPQDSGSVDILLKRDGWSFFYETRFLGSSGLTEEFGGNTFNFFNGHNGQSLSEQLETGTTLYHNLSVSKDFDSGLKATLGINNVTDEKPPVVSVDWRFDGLRTGVAAQNSWDIRGRSVFLNINKKF
ncbi:MAG: TonB-dependent receptor, partial [Porticoccaceae bacterium]|nr:TonB-dependent receptor [Porticoccaceae bacterium]